MNHMPTDFNDPKYRTAATAVDASFDPWQFRHRHLGPSADNVQRMLRVVGAPTLDALVDETIPGDIRQAQPLDLGPALAEPELLAKLRDVASRNRSTTSLIGQGYYGTIRPPSSKQRPGKPRLVHGLHTLSARDQPRPAGSLVQFSDHDLRPDRAQRRQRFAAGRGDRSGRSHGPCRTQLSGEDQSFLRRP